MYIAVHQRPGGIGQRRYPFFVGPGFGHGIPRTRPHALETACRSLGQDRKTAQIGLPEHQPEMSGRSMRESYVGVAQAFETLARAGLARAWRAALPLFVQAVEAVR